MVSFFIAVTEQPTLDPQCAVVSSARLAGRGLWFESAVV